MYHVQYKIIRRGGGLKQRREPRGGSGMRIGADGIPIRIYTLTSKTSPVLPTNQEAWIPVGQPGTPTAWASGGQLEVMTFIITMVIMSSWFMAPWGSEVPILLQREHTVHTNTRAHTFRTDKHLTQPKRADEAFLHSLPFTNCMLNPGFKNKIINVVLHSLHKSPIRELFPIRFSSSHFTLSTRRLKQNKYFYNRG